MKENKYDDSVFFEQYSHMPRSEQGLSAAGEWPALKALLPELAGKRVLDLGCGFGWHCRYAAEHGAARVLGTDLSQRMLERACAMTDSPVVEYRRAAIEDMRPAPADWDVVLSSLALHYVEDYAGVCRMVWDALSPRRMVYFFGGTSGVHGPGAAGLAAGRRRRPAALARGPIL